VTNVNEAPTDISLSVSSIASNTAPNSTVATLSATDPDLSDLLFAFTLEQGNGTTDADNALFSINGNQLVLANNAVLNPSTNPTLEVNIKVTDSGGLSFVTPLQLTVIETVVPTVITAITASQSYSATPNIRDIFDIDASRVLNATIVGFEFGDSLRIKNLADIEGIGFDFSFPPPVATIGDAFLTLEGLESSVFFVNTEEFRSVFGPNSIFGV
jgi:hypothetical protein